MRLPNKMRLPDPNAYESKYDYYAACDRYDQWLRENRHGEQCDEEIEEESEQW